MTYLFETKIGRRTEVILFHIEEKEGTATITLEDPSGQLADIAPKFKLSDIAAGIEKVDGEKASRELILLRRLPAFTDAFDFAAKHAEGSKASMVFSLPRLEFRQ